MLKSSPQIIGLTGSIATGKSTVSSLLRRMRHPVICADKLAHTAVKKRSPAFYKIIKKFGRRVLLKNGEINRKSLANLVFSKPADKKSLEAIIHPYVIKETKRQIKKLSKKRIKFIFLDVPLLFESGMQKLCDKTICVACTRQRQLQRLAKDRKLTPNEALARIHAQMPMGRKKRLADFVLQNNGTKIKLRNDLKEILKILI